MKILFSLLLLSALSGCSLFAKKPDTVIPEPQVVIQREYVVRIPPAELLELPPQTKDVDVDSAKQSDVAKWIIANEIRIKALEQQIIAIAKFLRAEQTKEVDQDIDE